jgi:hypothetical protein
MNLILLCVTTAIAQDESMNSMRFYGVQGG